MAARAKTPVSRKRAVSAAPPPSFEACVVTYISQDRAFQRVFAETDIEGMRNVVREKLNLAPNTRVRLAQVAEGRKIDLEDDADFYAFQLGARLKPELQVEVSVVAAPAAQLASPSFTATSINLDRAPPPPPTQTGKGEISQTANGSTLVSPPPKKKRQPRKSNLVIVDNNAEQGSGKAEGPETLAATTESIPGTSPADTEIPQHRPKKRDRKAAQVGEQQDIPAPETTKAAEPPAKKQRMSKADADVDMGSGAQSPVATTLPPPVRSERRSSTVLSIPDPDKPVSSVGSAADILRRWGAKSAATQVAAGSGDGPSTITDAPDQSTETKPKTKRKRKKKDQIADDTSTSTSIPAPTPTPEATQCLVCSSGTHEPSGCPLLSKRDSQTAKIVEERIQNLEDTQGPARIHQMLIGALRRWLKDTKKQVEVQNISVTPTPVPTVQKNESPAHSTPVPTLPKKSKLSSVAVGHQSEGSSTEDEDILKSVMENRVESTDEDEGEDEDMVDAPRPELELEPELQRETTPRSTPTSTPSPQPASVPLPPSSPATKALLQSQRMSQSSVRALLDGLESEEAGDGEKDSSDEEGSDLAQSTPSDIARRRHRKTVRLDVQDSDEEAAIRAQAQPQDDEEGSDVEMRDPEEERDLATLSQLLDSSQQIPEEIVGVVDEEKDEDDIEEYEDEENENKEALNGGVDSPIESPEQEPAATEEVAESAQEEEESESTEEEPEPEPTSPVPKKRGRPPLSQAVKDARAAEKARIQAEKAASQGDDPSVPRKRGRPRKSQPVEGEGDMSTSGKPESTAPAARTRSNSVGGSQELGPRPRGRPRISDAVRAEREAEKERIRAEKAIQRLEKKTAKANAKTTAKGKGTNAAAPVVDNGENEEGEGDDEDEDEDEDSTVRQSFRAPEEATAPATRTRSNSVGGSQELGLRPRGRPRISDAVRAEREAEKERIRAEKAIQRLEKKTAKANAKATAKGKGANATAPVVDNGENEEDEGDDEDEDEDSTVRQSFRAPEEAAESPVAPTWSTLKNPSSSRPGSSQADEIEWSAAEVGQGGAGKRPSGSHPSALKPTSGTRARKDSAPKPLFMPSSGLGPRYLPALSPLMSTPAPGKLLPLSQQTPSHTLQRRKSIGSASLPRFTDIQKIRDLQQRSRKERNRLLSSQSTALDSSQQLQPKPNGADEVVTIESSDEEVDSSADEAKKPRPPSQRKRPSAFAYFDQS
ncbi:hypothetical protein RSAG8_05504, partial [Rhizoctonia solani AG-8 WAC10335]